MWFYGTCGRKKDETISPCWTLEVRLHHNCCPHFGESTGINTHTHTQADLHSQPDPAISSLSTGSDRLTVLTTCTRSSSVRNGYSPLEPWTTRPATQHTVFLLFLLQKASSQFLRNSSVIVTFTEKVDLYRLDVTFIVPVLHWTEPVDWF